MKELYNTPATRPTNITRNELKHVIVSGGEYVKGVIIDATLRGCEDIRGSNGWICVHSGTGEKESKSVHSVT